MKVLILELCQHAQGFWKLPPQGIAVQANIPQTRCEADHPRDGPTEMVCMQTLVHAYLNSVQQMVSGELAGECLQTGFGRHGLPP